MREFRELSVDLIDESDNIRRNFSDEKLQELSASIQQHGILKRCSFARMVNDSR